jgi:glucose/arabinose dehydrogenase
VEDRVYQVGDRVIDEETGEEHEGPLVIAEITTHGAVLVSGGESLALIVARGPDGQFRTVSEDVYNLSNRPAVLGARFVDDDSSASNDALSGQLESIGRPAIKALVRLVRNPDFQGRGNAAVTLATIVSGLKPGPQRAEAAAAIRGMRVTPQDRATVKLKARALKLIKELP